MPNDATEAALGLLGLTGAFPSSSTIPAKRKQPPARPHSPPSLDGLDSQSSDSISCICGFSYDDGFSIGCDSCSRWSHAACFNIVENEVPDEWQCWICAPRPVDKDRAVKLQKARQRQAVSNAQANSNATSNGRRRSSPGVERKSRRPNTVTSNQDPSHSNDKPAHSNKRKRRASTSTSTHNAHSNPQEDEHVDIDEPCTHSYVPITKDIVPADEARDRLRRVASDWRGVSAINTTGDPHTPGCTTPALLTPDDLPYASPASLCPPQISIAPLHGPAASSVWPGLYANGGGSHSVRPPSYAVHANKPIPSSKLIAPYPSTIIPTSMYLRDPLNAYAHLGIPKPYVHLFGPPLDVALDARITGDQSRFVRSGCKPNAILRPMLCGKKARKEEGEDEAVTFGIFALRDLKPNEEVVLGWEWDDNNVVHHLPALIRSPFAFPPHQVQQFRNQMTSMLHSLASTFTTCACGAKANDCVLNRIAEFVENQTPLTPSPSPPSVFAKEKERHSGKARKSDPAESSPAPVDLGPLVGIERGFRTRERIPSSGGMGGVELVPCSPSAEAGPSRLTSDTPRRVSFPDDLLVPSSKAKRWKGKGRRAEEEESGGESDDVHGRRRARRTSGGSSDPEAMDVDCPPPPQEEESLPPRLRKAWIAKSLERLRVQRGGEDGRMEGVKDDYFDSRDMPPPPVPPSRTPPMLSTSLHPPLPISATSSSSSTSSTASSKHRAAFDGTASPSVPFSKLSLLSPVVPLSVNTPTSARPTSPSVLPPTPSTSKADSKKRKRPTHSPQPPPPPPLSDATPAKVVKSAKAKTVKGKERNDESEEEGEKEVMKSKPKTKPKSKAAKEKEKVARPSTPATESDEPVLKSAIVRRTNKKAVARAKDKGKERDREKGKVRSVSVDGRSTASASASATASPSVPPASLAPASSPGPPPTTPVVVLPELPPDPPDAVRRTIPVKAPDPVDEQESQAPNAMDIDRPPVPTPKASPAMSAHALPIPPVASRDLSTMLSSPSPAASPLVIQTSLPPAPSQPLTARDPTPPRTLPPPPPPEPVAVEPASLPQDAMVVDQPEDVPPNPPATVQPVADTEPAPSLPPPPESESPPEPEVAIDRHSSPAAQEPEREHTEPKGPPPPPKVKLSLKDFALRKKKQREEQKEREKEKPSAQYDSPRIPATSPLLEPDTPAIAIAHEVQPPNLVGLGIVNGDMDGDVRMAEEGKDVAEDTKEPGEPPPLAEPVNGIHDAHTPDIVDATPPADEPPPPPMSPVIKEATSDFVAPVPNGNGNGTYSASRRSPTPDRFFYGRKKTESSWDDKRYRSPSPDPSRRRRSPSEDLKDRREYRRADSIQTKVELIDSFVPNGLVAPVRDPSPVDPYPIPRVPSPATPSRTNSPSKMSYSPPRNSFPPVPPQPQSQPQSSQEDGEIFSPPPPKPPPLAPRSHTPPTHPRSFYTARGDISPTRRSPPPSAARRPLHPTQYPRNPGPPRLAPSAPRALRESLGYAPPPSYASGGQNAPYFAPRGPSADRERDRGRDWGRDRGDVERTWIQGPSRGRGRGTWGR